MEAFGLVLVTASPSSRERAFERLQTSELRARAFLDRAADTDPAFEPLESWAAENIARVLNPAADRRRVWRKSNVHWEFIRSGLHTPHTLLIPAWKRQPVVDPLPDLGPLGESFAVKPDLGGGGWGVTLGVRSWDEVERARRQLPDDDLLLQAMIEPERLGDRRAWFRVFYACGVIVPCWWDDRTRQFGDLVTEADRLTWSLDGLWQVAQTAAGIARLELFSTEAARTADGRWVVVDYVNDPIDLRLRPQAREGMPTSAAQRIAEAITASVGRRAG
ncbi:MAG: hypothetical protein FJZ97_07805 [Chloroflexi bacterium]|nr:hypothetical protein [Chloroflexota bacterium]